VTAPPGLRGLPANASRQRGQALLLILVALLIGFGAVFYTLVSPAKLTLEQDRTTNAAMAQAKVALIGYAVKDANRPGELPCPDVNNDGQLTLGIDFTGGAGSPCMSLLGRLPWKTLGLPDLRDGSGERLWYALSDNFHAGATPPLNSDTKGTLTVTGTSPASNVIAVIFSPSSVVGTQVRDTANENTIANYLEGGNETGIATSTFVTGAVTSTFNDRLLVITGADLMTPVEKRVVREILALLSLYRTAAGYYPWADNNFDGISDSSVRRGGPPLASASPTNWGSSGTPVVPPWMTANKWWKVIYYAVAGDEAPSGSGGMLDVDGNNARVVLFTTGPAVAGDGRPSTNPFPGYWCDYLENPVSGNNCNDNDTFWTPTSTAYARDRLYIIP
jgi:hypothetical protein